MPRPHKGEAKSKYISRCISEVMHEGGHTSEQAQGKCYGMWRTYSGTRKAVHKKKAIEVKD